MKKRLSAGAAAAVLAAIALLLAVYAAFFRAAESGQPLRGMRILLAGDSRSSTDYSFYKEIMERKSGATVLVDGASGRTAAYNASDEYFARISADEHDFSLWLVGGNDEGSAGTVGTFSPDSPPGAAENPKGGFIQA